MIGRLLPIWKGLFSRDMFALGRVPERTFGPVESLDIREHLFKCLALLMTAYPHLLAQKCYKNQYSQNTLPLHAAHDFIIIIRSLVFGTQRSTRHDIEGQWSLQGQGRSHDNTCAEWTEKADCFLAFKCLMQIVFSRCLDMLDWTKYLHIVFMPVSFLGSALLAF